MKYWIEHRQVLHPELTHLAFEQNSHEEAAEHGLKAEHIQQAVAQRQETVRHCGRKQDRRDEVSGIRMRHHTLPPRPLKREALPSKWSK